MDKEENIYDLDNLKTKVRVSALLRLLQHMDDEERLQYAITVREDLTGYLTYVKMDDISDMIDAFFNGAVPMEEIEEKIFDLPKNRLVHFYNDDLKNIENRYKNKIYRFAAYEASINRNVLFDNEEVFDIVVQKLHEVMNKSLNNLRTPNKIFKKMLDINNRYDASREEYIDLLGTMYAYATRQIVDPISSDATVKLNQAERLRINKEKSDKKIKVHKSKAATVALIWAAITSVGFATGLRKNFSKSHSVISTDSGLYSEDVERGSGVTVDDYDDYINEKFGKTKISSHNYDEFDKQRRLVSVFGDTQDNTFNLKVYDYTDVDISDNELQNMKLDDNYLIVDTNIDINNFSGLSVDGETKSNGLQEGQYIEKLGYYTGKAHRDVSRVNLIENNTVAMAALCGISIGISILGGCLSLVFWDTWKDDLKKYKKENAKLIRQINGKVNQAIKVLEDNIRNEEKNRIIAQDDNLEDLFKFVDEPSENNNQGRVM